MGWTAQDLYGSTPQAPSYSPHMGAAPTQQMGTHDADLMTGWKGLVDPGNPLFWLGVVLVVTVGLGGVAGSVRLGRARLSGSLERD